MVKEKNILMKDHHATFRFWQLHSWASVLAETWPLLTVAGIQWCRIRGMLLRRCACAAELGFGHWDVLSAIYTHPNEGTHVPNYRSTY